MPGHPTTGQPMVLSGCLDALVWQESSCFSALVSSLCLDRPKSSMPPNPTPPDGPAAVLARVKASVQTTIQGGACQLTFQAMGTRCAVSIAAPANRFQELTSM